MNRFGVNNEDVSISPTDGSSESTPKVSFHKVVIQEYAYTVGDNPTCSGGAPLSLTWNPMHTESLDLDAYEELREVDRVVGRREMFLQLTISKEERLERLKDAGVSTLDIDRAIREATKCRTERRQTLQMLRRAKMEEIIEKIKKGLRDFFTNRGRKEAAYIKHALSFA